MGTSDGARKGWTEESRAKRAAAMKAKWADPEFREKQARIRRGEESKAQPVEVDRPSKNKWTEDKRKAFSERMKVRAQNPEVREKLSKAAQARWDKPEAKERASKIQKDRHADPEVKARHVAAKASPETRAKIAQKTREYWASLPVEEKNQRMRDLRRRFKGGYRLTAIEAAVMLELNARGLFYQVHAQVDNYTADLLVHTPRLIIECDGAWHHDQRRDTDEVRDARLLELGYPTLRLSEAEIKTKDWSRLNEALMK